METKQTQLHPIIYGVIVKIISDRTDTAVLENFNDHYDVRNLRPFLDEIKRFGIKNFVVDFSQFSEGYQRQFFGLMDGAFTRARFNARYTGITVDKVCAGEGSSYRDQIVPKIAESLQAAIEGF